MCGKYKENIFIINFLFNYELKVNYVIKEINYRLLFF